MTRSIVLSGIGGQGTVLASRLIASVALSRGVPVRTAETIGMAQRGGTVLTHVRYGDTPTDVPHTSLVPLGAASLAIAFEPGEAQRVLPYLAPDAAMVVARRAIPPTTATLAGVDYDGSEQLAYLKQQVPTLVVVDGDAVCRALGNPRVLNVVLLGAAAGTGMLGMEANELACAVERLVKPAFIDINKQALEAGERIARAQRAELAGTVPDHGARRWQPLG